MEPRLKTLNVGRSVLMREAVRMNCSTVGAQEAPTGTWTCCNEAHPAVKLVREVRGVLANRSMWRLSG